MAFQRTFRRAGDHHADCYALEGVEVKIGETFHPPKKVTLPVGWHQKDPSEVLSLTYDFSLEKQILEKTESERLEKQRKEDEKKAIIAKKEIEKNIENERDQQVTTSITNPVTSANSIFSNVGSDILVPTAVTNSGHKRSESFGKNTIDFSDFEGNATSPFELVELQTINDLDVLKSVLQPTLVTSTSASASQSSTNPVISSPASNTQSNSNFSATPTVAASGHSPPRISDQAALVGPEQSSGSIAIYGAPQSGPDLSYSLSNQLPGYRSMSLSGMADTQTAVTSIKPALSKSVPDLTCSDLVDVTDSPTGPVIGGPPVPSATGRSTYPQTSLPSVGLPYSLRQTTCGNGYGMQNQGVHTNSVPAVSNINSSYTGIPASSNPVLTSIPQNVMQQTHSSGYDSLTVSQRAQTSVSRTSYNMRDTTTQGYSPLSNVQSMSYVSQTGQPSAPSNLYTIPYRPPPIPPPRTSYNAGSQMPLHARNTQLEPLENITSTAPQIPPIPVRPRTYQTSAASAVVGKSVTAPGLANVPAQNNLAPTNSGQYSSPPQGHVSPMSPGQGFPKLHEVPSPSTYSRPEYTSGDQNGSFDTSSVRRRTAQRRSNMQSNAALKRHSFPLPPIGRLEATDDKETDSYQSSLQDPQPRLTDSEKRFVTNVSGMGFPAPRVARAVQKFGEKEREVFDFLFAVDELCKAGHPGDDAEVALALHDHKAPKALEFLELAKTFKELGFKEENIHAALAAADNDSEKALDYLTTGT